MRRSLFVGSARGRVGAALLALALGTSACIPYTVGTTARPLRAGENATTMSVFVMPPVGRINSSRSVSYLAIDLERRFGIDARSDWGLRVPSGSGIVFNYKRLLSDTTSRMHFAIMSGAGFVNMGNHAHAELTLLASGSESLPGSEGGGRTPIVPYGGLRVMQVAPLAPGQAHDRPTAGGFIGLKIGRDDFGASPEVGVFYDHSALGVRRGDLVIVPAINVHGERLIGIIRDLMRPGGIFRYTVRRAREPDEPHMGSRGRDTRPRP